MARKSQPKPSPSVRLDEYQRKRNFGKTPEPGGVLGSKAGNTYVIQEHHARSHHFDFRLEMDGVFVSWAVPKTIPEDPSEKRLAVHVEDHPLDYGNFEGEIPKGNYGAGKVAIWDTGEWQPLEKNWKSHFEKGKLKFRLKGKRLDGIYLLARMGAEPNWLLRRLADDSTKPFPAKAVRDSASFVKPQLARIVSSVPSGKEWCHEIKFDGYRLIAVKTGGTTNLFTRNGHDWTERFGNLSTNISKISPEDFVLDGEAVVFDGKGRTSFGGLQDALKANPQKIVFVAFDLLNFAGNSLCELPLQERIAQMESFVAEDGARIRRSHVWPGSAGKQLFRQACQNGLEGIVSKQLSARYISDSRRDWVKSKCRARQEFVVCGYTRPKGSRSGFGALVLGSHENGKLVPRGKVGTGFTDGNIKEMLERFKPLISPKPLFEFEEKDITWLRPELVAEIEFAEITREGSIRQGSFLGIREDKAADSIHLESVSPLQASEVLGIVISHPDRVVFPDMGITKIEVVRYYDQIGELMMPYVANRPLAIVRAPEGIGGDLFFQKSFPNHLPKNVNQKQLPDGATVFSISNTAGLVSLAQFGALEFHPWGSTLDKPEIAEFLTWDLDPDSAVPWKETLGAAFLLRDYLHGLGLEPMVKTSGGKGLHLMLRIRRVHDWDAMKKFTKDVSRNVAAMNPGRFVIVSAKTQRKGKIFIDWMRNGKGSTCIAPWCVRARPGAKVSMPIDWADLPDVPVQGFSMQEPLVVPAEWRNPKAQSINAAMISQAGSGG